MTIIYDIFSEEDFDIPIYIDSPMAQKISSTYCDILNEDALEKWKSVLAWKNLHFVKDYMESRELRDSGKPCIVIASSGFMVAGRSVAWCASLLPHAEDRIVTIGYAPPGSMAYTIKQGEQKTISISGKRYANRCQVTNLTSFSSHIQRDSMITEYGKANAEKLVLVHGDMDGRKSIKPEIEAELSRNNLTTRVVIAEKIWRLTCELFEKPLDNRGFFCYTMGTKNESILRSEQNDYENLYDSRRECRKS